MEIIGPHNFKRHTHSLRSLSALIRSVNKDSKQDFSNVHIILEEISKGNDDRLPELEKNIEHLIEELKKMLCFLFKVQHREATTYKTFLTAYAQSHLINLRDDSSKDSNKIYSLIKEATKLVNENFHEQKNDLQRVRKRHRLHSFVFNLTNKKKLNKRITRESRDLGYQDTDEDQTQQEAIDIIAYAAKHQDTKEIHQILAQKIKNYVDVLEEKIETEQHIEKNILFQEINLYHELEHLQKIFRQKKDKKVENLFWKLQEEYDAALRTLYKETKHLEKEDHKTLPKEKKPSKKELLTQWGYSFEKNNTIDELVQGKWWEFCEQLAKNIKKTSIRKKVFSLFPTINDMATVGNTTYSNNILLHEGNFEALLKITKIKTLYLYELFQALPMLNKHFSIQKEYTISFIEEVMTFAKEKIIIICDEILPLMLDNHIYLEEKRLLTTVPFFKALTLIEEKELNSIIEFSLPLLLKKEDIITTENLSFFSELIHATTKPSDVLLSIIPLFEAHLFVHKNHSYIIKIAHESKTYAPEILRSLLPVLEKEHHFFKEDLDFEIIVRAIKKTIKKTKEKTPKILYHILILFQKIQLITKENLPILVKIIKEITMITTHQEVYTQLLPSIQEQQIEKIILKRKERKKFFQICKQLEQNKIDIETAKKQIKQL